MAPSYRTTGHSRRTNRGQVDHDVFEGLPVRNWRREGVTVAPPPLTVIPTQQNKWDVELPYGMPKDSHLLPPHSQELLRLARSGKLYQKRPQIDDEEQDADVLPGESKDKKDDDPKERGYYVKTWKAVARHLEGPEFEYLAKRRKGLRGAVLPGQSPVQMVTKATVRKIDAQGNAYVEEVVMTDGQPLEGEVISTTVVEDSSAVVADATPLRKRPNPPKRRAKGPGRGRKKKAMIPIPAAGGQATIVKIEGVTVDKVGAGNSTDPEHVKLDADADAAGTATQNIDEDVQMDDGDDDEGEDGEEGSEDDDEEDDGDDQDQDQAMVDNAATPTPIASAKPDHPDVPMLALPPKPDFTTKSVKEDSGNHKPQSEPVASPLKATDEPHAHDDEAEADGDDDDVEAQNPAQDPYINKAQTTDASSILSYYPPGDMNLQSIVENTVPEDFEDEDDEMLDFAHEGEQSGLINDGYPYQPNSSDYPQALQTDIQASLPSDPGQYGMSTSTRDFAHSLPADTMPTDQGTEPHAEDPQDSFEDLLGGEDDFDVPDEGDGDDDLMAGLDAHLLGVVGGDPSAVHEEENTKDSDMPPPVQESIQGSPDIIAEPVQDSALEAVQEPLEESLLEPVQEPVQESVKELFQEPSQESVQESVQGFTQEPTQEPIQEPTQEPTQEPVQEPIPEPIQEPAHEPALELAQEPIQNSIQEPTQESIQDHPADPPTELVQGLTKESTLEPILDPVQEPPQQEQSKPAESVSDSVPVPEPEPELATITDEANEKKEEE